MYNKCKALEGKVVEYSCKDGGAGVGRLDVTTSTKIWVEFEDPIGGTQDTYTAAVLIDNIEEIHEL